MKHYLVDGYNLLFYKPKTRISLKEKRLEIITFLNDFIASLSINVTLVFDGSDPHSRHSFRHHFDALEIIYTTKGISADTYILEKLDASQHPEHYIVVTNDRDLATSCKVLRATILSIDQFLSFLLKKKQKHKKKTTVSRRILRDSDAEISRLLRIFEERLNEN